MPASISARAISATSACSKLIGEKMPVSISLGLWMTLLSYVISIPLGIRKAVKDGSRFDIWTSAVIIVGYAIPGFLFAILLIILFAGGIVLRLVPAARPDLGQYWAHVLPWYRKHPRLFLAPGAAADGDGALGLRHHDAAHQELVPRRDPQAIRGDGAGEGLTERQVLYGHVFRNAMLIVIAGFPGAFIRLLRRLAAHRDDLLARRARPARLRVGAQPRLSGGLRDALHLLADGPGREPDLRPHLHLDRSADRFRDARGLMDRSSRTTATPRARDDRRRRRGGGRSRRRGDFRLSPINQRRWQNFKANRRGYWSLVDLPRPVRRSRSFAEFIANDRPIVDLLQGRDPLSGASIDYPESKFGGFLAATTDYRDPFIQDEIHANGWMVLAADPLLLPHGQQRDRRRRRRRRRGG